MTYHIGLKIKKLRLFKDFTQEYMAEKLGISQQHYSKIERNELQLDYDKIEEIAKILGKKAEEIVNMDENYFLHQENNNFSENQYSSNGIQIYQNQMLFQEMKASYEARIEQYEKEIAYLKATLDKVLQK